MGTNVGQFIDQRSRVGAYQCRVSLTYKDLMKLNRNSTEFNNNKQEFNVYKNVLQRLINRAKNIYYSTQFENNKGDGRKTWRKWIIYYIGNPQNQYRTQ